MMNDLLQICFSAAFVVRYTTPLLAALFHPPDACIAITRFRSEGSYPCPPSLSDSWKPLILLSLSLTVTFHSLSGNVAPVCESFSESCKGCIPCRTWGFTHNYLFLWRMLRSQRFSPTFAPLPLLALFRSLMVRMQGFSSHVRMCARRENMMHDALFCRCSPL